MYYIHECIVQEIADVFELHILVYLIHYLHVVHTVMHKEIRDEEYPNPEFYHLLLNVLFSNKFKQKRNKSNFNRFIFIPEQLHYDHLDILNVVQFH
jgi:hypothetical protein